MDILINQLIREVKQRNSYYGICWSDEYDNTEVLYHSILYSDSAFALGSLDSFLLKSFKYVRKEEQLQLIIDLMNCNKSNEFELLIVKLLDQYLVLNFASIKYNNLYYNAITNNLMSVLKWLSRNNIQMTTERDFMAAGSISQLSDSVVDLLYFKGSSIENNFPAKNLFVKIVEGVRFLNIREPTIDRINKIIEKNSVSKIETFFALMALESKGVNLIKVKLDFYSKFPLIKKLSFNYKYTSDDGYLEMLYDQEFIKVLHNFFESKEIGEATKKCFGINSSRFIKVVINNIIKNDRINIEFLYLLYQLKLMYSDNYSDFLDSLEKRKIPFFIHNGGIDVVGKISNLFWILSSKISNFKKNVFVDSYFDSFVTPTARATVLSNLSDIYSMVLNNANDVVDILQVIPAKEFTINTIHDVLSVKLLKYQKENFDLGLLQKENLQKIDALIISDGYSIAIPKDQHQLIDWTIRLKNCIGVANYGKKALQNKCILIGLFKNNKIEYVIEIINYKIEQFAGFANMHPDNELKNKIINDLINLNLLTIDQLN